MISPDHLILSALGYLSAGLLFTIPANSLMQTNKKYETKTNGRKLPNLNKILIMKSTAMICIVISVITYTKAINVDYATNQYFLGRDRENIFLNRILNEWPNSQILEEVGISEIRKPVDNCVLIKEISSRIISISYRNSNGWYLKTVCDENSGNLNEALESISKAIKFDPINPSYLVGKAKLEIAAARLADAKATIAKITEVDPTNAELPALNASVLAIK
jgi:Flp pilus assembly protein TadD